MLTRDERGATAVLVAAMMVVLIGMAAIAIDVGAGFNERRQDQTAADVAVMAGAINSVNGGAAVRTQVLDLALRNLSYTSAEEQALWESCVDPAAQRNVEAGDNFVALPAPAGWTLTDPANWCISFDSAKGLLRVRVPDQVLDTTFGAVLGTDTLTTSASAVSEVTFGATGGILPFGLTSSTGAGDHICLSSGPTGLAVDPCDGSTTGNFGVLKGRQFGNAALGTSVNCNASPVGQTLAQNIAIGYDHIVVTDPDGLASNEVRDNCFNPFVDTLNTDTGFPNNGAQDGLVGPVPGGFTPRLQASGATTTNFGYAMNDEPLWDYLLPQTTNGSSDPSWDGNPDYQGTFGSADAPAICDPDSFASGSPFDWDGDGTLDQPASWQHMEACLEAYESGSYTAVMINDSILSNTARFAYVPQFWENSLGTGNSWLHIRRFRAVYLQATIWKSGSNWAAFYPGEACAGCSGSGWDMKHLTAFTFSDSALPPELRGDPIPGSIGLNPFDATLKR